MRPAAKIAATRVSGALSALVIFAKFSGEAVGDDQKPAWADDLFDPNLPGSFSHFYNEMSRGQLQVGGQVLPKRYRSRSPSSAYVASQTGTPGNYAAFNLEILEQADGDVDMGRFDNDGPDGRPNSGDDDGYVDVVFINLLTVPRDFFIGGATGLASLGLDTDFISDDEADGGGRIRVRSRFSGFGGTTQRGHEFTVTAASMCHEFGHVLGLPDLFDQSTVGADSQLDPAEDSAGIGKWGLMGLGTLGWGIEDGPNAFSAWSLAKLGWIGRDNAELELLTQSQVGLEIEQIDSGGRVYRIPVSSDEYFLIENRQSSGSFYNRNIPAGGLLVWHADERSDNDHERHKQVDLVCADGLFSERGFPGSVPDPVAGGDNLDFWAAGGAYAEDHNGNQGDATDPFDGVRYTRFAADTNPGARVYTGDSRNLQIGFALENIEPLSGRRMGVDILLRQPLSGHISTDTTWSGQVLIDGDVIVEPGTALTIAAGTLVQVAARSDSRAGGFDTNRVELIAYGDLIVGGGPRRPRLVRVGSVVADPQGLVRSAAHERAGAGAGSGSAVGSCVDVACHSPVGAAAIAAGHNRVVGRGLGAVGHGHSQRRGANCGRPNYGEIRTGGSQQTGARPRFRRAHRRGWAGGARLGGGTRHIHRRLQRQTSRLVRRRHGAGISRAGTVPDNRAGGGGH